MSTSMTIEQVKNARTKLESEILKLFNSFEKDTGSFIDYTSVRRKISKKKSKTEDYGLAYPEERNGPIENIEINLRFDI